MQRTSFWFDRPSMWAPTPVGILAFLTCLSGTMMAFFYAAPERTMGVAQKIMYFHVPAAFVTYLAYTVLFVGSCAYLWNENEGWDRIARAAGEMGMAFASIMIITGPLWAKPVWKVYWTWDPRLTSAFVLWLIYGVYILLRMVVDRPDKQAKFCAVLGVIGMADLPIIHYSVQYWDSMHPKAVVMQEKIGGGLGHTSMRVTLLVCFIAQALLCVTFLCLRHNQLRLAARVDALDHAAERQRLLGPAPASEQGAT